MKPGGRLRRYTRLERSTPLQGGAQLKRGKALRQRSAKQEALYRVRRPLVASLLEERPVCERCHQARSTDVHEPGMRSRGADICDPAQCVCLCRPCHSWVHDNPAAATRAGWLISSGEKAECGVHAAVDACETCRVCRLCGPCECELAAEWAREAS